MEHSLFFRPEGHIKIIVDVGVSIVLDEAKLSC
jgi:hypothetical protein